MDRHRHNSTPRVFVPKHFNSWNMGTGITSLNFMTTAGRAVIDSTDRRGLRRPILVQFLLLLFSFPSTASMTGHHRHNGPSRVFVLKHFNSWNLGTGITSLIFTKNLQDGLSEPRRTVTSFVIPHFVKLPHLPSAAALRCHLQTVTSTTDRHKLRRWSLLHFFAPNLRIQLWTDFLQNKEKLL